MNNKFTSAFCLSFTIFLSGACSKARKDSIESSPRSVSGQIFIIQKNRVNVKLGGVRISFVPLQKFRERSLWIAQNQEKAKYLLRYESKLDQVDQMIESAATKPFSSHLDEFLSTARRIQNSNERKFKDNPLVAELQKMSLVQSENSDIFESSDFRGLPEAQWSLSAIFFDWLDRSESHGTITDADGNYSFSLPEEARGYLIAQASRNLIKGNFEHYFWIHEIAGPDSNPVHLTSTNLLDPITLSEIIHQSSATQRTSMKIIEDEFDLSSLEWFDQAGSLLREATANQNKIDSRKLEIKNLEEEINEIQSMSEP